MMRNDSTLVVIPFGSNVGYAIAPLEKLFFEVALSLGGGVYGNVHFAYKNLDRGRPLSLPPDFHNVWAYNVYDVSQSNNDMLDAYLRRYEIDLVLLFDVGPISPLIKVIRRAGVRTVLSYYGAPVSSVMPLWKLILKKCVFWCSRSRVNGLIFESQAMADLAIWGYGVPRHLIDIVPLGVDIEKFRPVRSNYAYEQLNIPSDRKIIIYGGHMERRKGVHTLVEAAIELLVKRGRKDICFLICGNKGDESREFEAMYEGMGIEAGIIFGGYRNDMVQLYSTSLCGVIPSTGWDSFPRTSIEMAAAGLPVIASRLQGLCEAVIDGETGLLFTPGDSIMLANLIEKMVDEPDLAEKLGKQGRRRCEQELNLEMQQKRLAAIVQRRLLLSQD